MGAVPETATVRVAEVPGMIVTNDGCVTIEGIVQGVAVAVNVAPKVAAETQSEIAEKAMMRDRKGAPGVELSGMMSRKWTVD